MERAVMSQVVWRRLLSVPLTVVGSYLSQEKNYIPRYVKGVQTLKIVYKWWLAAGE
jgi:hypothetical protein